MLSAKATSTPSLPQTVTRRRKKGGDYHPLLAIAQVVCDRLVATGSDSVVGSLHPRACPSRIRQRSAARQSIARAKERYIGRRCRDSPLFGRGSGSRRGRRGIVSKRILGRLWHQAPRGRLAGAASPNGSAAAGGGGAGAGGVAADSAAVEGAAAGGACTERILVGRRRGRSGNCGCRSRRRVPEREPLGRGRSRIAKRIGSGWRWSGGGRWRGCRFGCGRGCGSRWRCTERILAGRSGAGAGTAGAGAGAAGAGAGAASPNGSAAAGAGGAGAGGMAADSVAVEGAAAGGAAPNGSSPAGAGAGAGCRGGSRIAKRIGRRRRAALPARLARLVRQTDLFRGPPGPPELRLEPLAGESLPVAEAEFPWPALAAFRRLRKDPRPTAWEPIRSPPVAQPAEDDRGSGARRPRHVAVARGVPGWPSVHASALPHAPSDDNARSACEAPPALAAASRSPDTTGPD